MCLLGVSLTLLPILGVKSPENPNFGGVNRRFQAKRAKYWKFHVIETPASISTKYCTTMEAIKWSLWVVPIGAQQIQDGGRSPFWKITKILTSPEGFDQSLRNLVHWCKMAQLTAPTVKKFDFQKSKMADGRHFKNRKIAISLQPCDRFWWNLAQWHILVPYKGSFVKITNFWNPTWRRPTFKNHKNRDISATVWPIFTKFGTLMQHGSLNLSDR